MSIKVGSILVWVVLAVLTVWNIRINIKLMKMRMSVAPRDPRNLSATEMKTVKALNHEKRKWAILSQVLFWTSLILVIAAQSMGILVYFLDLYTLTCIVSNKIDLQAAQVLTSKKSRPAKNADRYFFIYFRR